VRDLQCQQDWHRPQRHTPNARPDGCSRTERRSADRRMWSCLEMAGWIRGHHRRFSNCWKQQTFRCANRHNSQSNRKPSCFARSLL